jgi:effector-binding domain-containing protein
MIQINANDVIVASGNCLILTFTSNPIIMKALKLIGIVLLSVVILVLVAAAFAPSENNISRFTTVQAPLEVVQAHTHSFEGMLTWSPWADKDPNATSSIENDGQVGALYSWSGADSLVGEGSQTITGLEDMKVVTHLRFIRPWEAEADATTTLEETEEGVRVTWSYHDHMPYPFNLLNLVMDMDAALGPDFELGMSRLKDRCETAYAEKNDFDGFVVTKSEFASQTFAGFRKQVSWEDLGEHFEMTFGQLGKMIAKGQLTPTGAPVGIYFTWDEVNQQTDCMIGFPVNGPVEGLEQQTLSGNALTIEYYGPEEETGKAHEAMAKYMEYHGLNIPAVAMEQYMNSRDTEPDPAKRLTKVIYVY